MIRGHVLVMRYAPLIGREASSRRIVSVFKRTHSVTQALSLLHGQGRPTGALWIVAARQPAHRRPS
jgi:hypothetical protein